MSKSARWFLFFFCDGPFVSLRRYRATPTLRASRPYRYFVIRTFVCNTGTVILTVAHILV